MKSVKQAAEEFAQKTARNIFSALTGTPAAATDRSVPALLLAEAQVSVIVEATYLEAVDRVFEQMSNDNDRVMVVALVDTCGQNTRVRGYRVMIAPPHIMLHVFRGQREVSATNGLAAIAQLARDGYSLRIERETQEISPHDWALWAPL